MKLTTILALGMISLASVGMTGCATVVHDGGVLESNRYKCGGNGVKYHSMERTYVGNPGTDAERSMDMARVADKCGTQSAVSQPDQDDPAIS